MNLKYKINTREHTHMHCLQYVSEVGETLGIDQVSRDFSVSRESQSRETNFLSLSLSLGLEKPNFSVSVSVSSF